MAKWLLGLALVLLPVPALAQMGPGGGMPGGGGGFPGGGGGGRRGGGGFGGMRGGQGGAPQMRDIKIKRDRFDKTVQALFAEADANHDGTITDEEVRAVIQGKRDAILRARFDRIDANHDHMIDANEFLAWQHAMGDAALDENQPQTDDGSALPDAIDVPGKGESLQDRAIQRLIGPLDALTLSKANTNYDKGVTLDELVAFENAKFDAADSDHNGELDGEELRAAGLGAPRRGPGAGTGTGGGFGGRRGGRGGGGGADGEQ